MFLTYFWVVRGVPEGRSKAARGSAKAASNNGKGMGIMRTLETRCGVALGLLVVVASGCGDPAAIEGAEGEPIAFARQPLTITVAGTSMSQVRAAINQAAAGDTVKFPAGTYVLDQTAFLFKSEVAFLGDAAGGSIIKSNDAATRSLEHKGTGAVKNATIANFVFENIRLRFEGSSSNFATSSNIYLRNVTFRGGKGDNFDGNGYLTFAYSDGRRMHLPAFERNRRWQRDQKLASSQYHHQRFVHRNDEGFGAWGTGWLL